jgi:hypothetical protein
MFGNPLISYALYFFTFFCILIYKYFLKEGGIILKMDGIFPRKIGDREKESKWAPHVQKLGGTGIFFCFIDLWVKFLQQEANRIQLQVENF